MRRLIGVWLTLLIFFNGPVLDGKVRFDTFPLTAHLLARHLGQTIQKIMRLLYLLTLFITTSSAYLYAANIETYSLTWSGASLGNSATASGLITIDTDAIPNNGELTFIAPLDFIITINGASAGNGTFVLGDFYSFIFGSGGTLDFSKELVSQNNWGNSSDNTGAFTIFGARANGSPYGQGSNFIITTNYGGLGDSLVITSFTPMIPELSNYAAIASAAVMSVIIHRRRRST